MSKKISRRNFIKGAAAGAVSVAAFGLVGCTQQTTQTPDPTPAPPEAPSPASTSSKCYYATECRSIS